MEKPLEERVEEVGRYLDASIGSYAAEQEHPSTSSERALVCFEVLGHLEQVARMLGTYQEDKREVERHKAFKTHQLSMREEHPEQRKFIRRAMENQRRGEE